jgi:hypothetical protein
MAKKVEEKVDVYPKVFVAENGEKVIARDEVQAAAFKNAGLEEEA